MNQDWQSPPTLVTLKDQEQYRAFYEGYYCQPRNRILTSDGYRVRFFPEAFDDAFFESADRALRDKCLFSHERAARINWIQWALANPNAELYEGWNRDFRIPNPSRRAALVTGSFGAYVVIVYIKDANTAKFITAYLPDHDGVRNIRSGNKWPV